MPTYTYICPECGHVDDNVLVTLSRIDVPRDCNNCGAYMNRQFPSVVHTVSDRSTDGKDPGKVIKEKNEKLKNREAGYSHEQSRARQNVEAQTQKLLGGTS